MSFLVANAGVLDWGADAEPITGGSPSKLRMQAAAKRAAEFIPAGETPPSTSTAPPISLPLGMRAVATAAEFVPADGSVEDYRAQDPDSLAVEQRLALMLNAALRDSKTVEALQDSPAIPLPSIKGQAGHPLFLDSHQQDGSQLFGKDFSTAASIWNFATAAANEYPRSYLLDKYNKILIEDHDKISLLDLKKLNKLFSAHHTSFSEIRSLMKILKGGSITATADQDGRIFEMKISLSVGHRLRRQIQLVPQHSLPYLTEEQIAPAFRRLIFVAWKYGPNQPDSVAP